MFLFANTRAAKLRRIRRRQALERARLAIAAGVERVALRIARGAGGGGEAPRAPGGDPARPIYESPSGELYVAARPNPLYCRLTACDAGGVAGVELTHEQAQCLAIKLYSWSLGLPGLEAAPGVGAGQ